MGKVIAIDGPSGAGKSTVAKLLSEMLGFKYLDTGALYRAVALGLIRDGVTLGDSGKLAESLSKMSVAFSEGKVFLNGRDVSDEIRTTEIGHYSSVFSAEAPVRDFLLPVQKKAAMEDNLVAEGRDMTTVVFPDAWKKFYIDASYEARIKRRYLQLKKNGIPATMESAQEDIMQRDRRDSSRSVAPLRKAEDAIFIDSSDLTLKEVMEKVLEAIKEE